MEFSDSQNNSAQLQCDSNNEFEQLLKQMPLYRFSNDTYYKIKHQAAKKNESRISIGSSQSTIKINQGSSSLKPQSNQNLDSAANLSTKNARTSNINMSRPSRYEPRATAENYTHQTFADLLKSQNLLQNEPKKAEQAPRLNAGEADAGAHARYADKIQASYLNSNIVSSKDTKKLDSLNKSVSKIRINLKDF